MEVVKDRIILHSGGKRKPLTPAQVINKQRIVYEFDGHFKDSFGTPEAMAKWFITGPSFSGKSSFLFILSEYLCKFGKVYYNSLEEGNSLTVADRMMRHGLDKQGGRFYILDKTPATEFKERMLKKRSANFGIIDSVQHAEMNRRSYLEMTDALCIPRRGKSLLFVNHWVKNDLTKFIKHDCDIKIEVIGFIANVESRYGGNKPFIIWEEGAKRYWGKKYAQVRDGKYWPGRKK